MRYSSQLLYTIFFYLSSYCNFLIEPFLLLVPISYSYWKVKWFQVLLFIVGTQLNGLRYCCCLHTVNWLQVLLPNTNNSIQHYSFVDTQLNGFQYSKWLNSYIWPIDWTLTSTTTSGQSGSGRQWKCSYSP